jgi:hypothetical protein
MAIIAAILRIMRLPQKCGAAGSTRRAIAPPRRYFNFAETGRCAQLQY